MNISEFERSKPKKTMAAINNLINSLELQASNPIIMEDYDEGFADGCEFALEPLKEIKKLFMAGE